MIFSKEDFDFNRLAELVNTESPFTIGNGIKAVEISKGYAHLELETTSSSLNINGTVHGGLIFTLVDMAAGAAAMSLGNPVTTLSGNVNFFRPAFEEKLIAKCKAIHTGRRTIVCETEVFNEKDKLISKSTITMFVLAN